MIAFFIEMSFNVIDVVNFERGFSSISHAKQ